MKLSEAMKIIEGRPNGYRVHFDRVGGGCLTSDFFPDRGEKLIETEIEAWRLANSFSSDTFGKYVNIYVIDQNFSPVPGYEAKRIPNR